jgi:hypothetical protein
LIAGINKFTKKGIENFLQEINLLFAGMHYRLFLAHPKLSDGSIDYDKAADWIADPLLHAKIGLYKIHIGNKYLEAAKAAKGVLMKSDDVLEEKTSAENKEMVAEFEMVDYEEGVTYKDLGSVIQITTVVLKNNKSVADDIYNNNNFILASHALAVINDEELLQQLVVDENLKEPLLTEMKITKLENCIKQYNLMKYLDKLNFVQRDVKTHFLQYKNNTTFLTLYKRRAYDKDATDIIEAIQNANDPREQILKLIENIAVLFEKTADKDLVDAGILILLKVYTMLLDSVKASLKKQQQVDPQADLSASKMSQAFGQSSLFNPKQSQISTQQQAIQQGPPQAIQQGSSIFSFTKGKNNPT